MDRAREQFANVCFRKSAETAHDLKTPLNVAVLNLELLRMRARRVGDGEEDARLAGYARAIEIELRRMARIFDAFFVFSVPPKEADELQDVELSGLLTDILQSLAVPASEIMARRTVRTFPGRAREMFKLYVAGALRAIAPGTLTVETDEDSSTYRVTLAGNPSDDNLEVDKLFKFYFTDAAGLPELSLATARLIAETLGGDLTAANDPGKLQVVLSLPSGEQ